MNPTVRKYLASIGSKGGKKSRRTLTAEQARAMVLARMRKKRNVPNAAGEVRRDAVPSTGLLGLPGSGDK